MRTIAFYVIAMAVVWAALLSASGCESRVKVSNTPPGDIVLSASYCFIETGGTISLSGSAIDDDGDPLTFRWTATAGSFSPESATGASVEWTAPAAPCSVTITMSVTDDIATVTKTQNITVCTPVQGSILTNRTLSKAGSVYIVKNTGGLPLLPIASTATLTIEAGVTIVFNGGGGFEAYGRIVAEGTPGEKIRFRGNACGSSTGLWDGIYMTGNFSEAVFRNVELGAGSNGIQVTEGAHLTLDRCAVYDNSNIGVSVVASTSEAHIVSSDIWDNGNGVEILNARVEIRSSSIQNNLSDGLKISYSLSETNVTIDSTTITNNGEDGIELQSLANPTITNCTFSANGAESGYGYAIRLAGYTGSDTIHAENNFWGSGNTTEEKIELVIFDGRDQTGLAYVGFIPWLSASPEPLKADPVGGAKERQWARSLR